jgi:8-oxo-dGTP pyrophosphatase MutT (NUDIX family)
MPVRRQKVYCYITHGDRLLVLRHVDDPEAGVQVPGGSVEPGETPPVAALREAEEETGLRGLALINLLGERERDMSDFGRDEIQHRWFYHLDYEGTTTEPWRHSEMTPSEGEGPIAFELTWASLRRELPSLIAGMGDLLPRLLESMSVHE